MSPTLIDGKCWDLWRPLMQKNIASPTAVIADSPPTTPPTIAPVSALLDTAAVDVFDAAMFPMEVDAGAEVDSGVDGDSCTDSSASSSKLK